MRSRWTDGTRTRGRHGKPRALGLICDLARFSISSTAHAPSLGMKLAPTVARKVVEVNDSNADLYKVETKSSAAWRGNGKLAQMEKLVS
jgi:hypothetical protein